MKILIINGPNLNLLGLREPAIYGTQNYAALEAFCKDACREAGFDCEVFQSNHEGELVDRLHQAHGVYDGIVYNPGAHTHYSYALRDAVGSIDVPVAEVHISDVDAREPFRAVSVIAPACVAQVKGLGAAGYRVALDLLLEGARDRLGEGFERRAQGKVIVGTPEGPLVKPVDGREG